MKKFYFLVLTVSSLLSNIAFGQAPVINTILGPANVCYNPSSPFVTFTASASNSPTGYFWTVDPLGSAQMIVTAGSAAFDFGNINGTYVIYCAASNASGSSPWDSIVVNVFEKPVVSFSGNAVVCQGGSTNLSASPTVIQASNTLNQGSSTLFFSWSPPAGLNTTVGPDVIATPVMTTTYTVSVLNGICTSTLPITISVDTLCTVGMAEYKSALEVVKLYPNPASGQLHIDLGSLNGDEMDLQVISTTGQLVLAGKIKEAQSIQDISALPPGIYIVSLRQKNSLKTLKLLKE